MRMRQLGGLGAGLAILVSLSSVAGAAGPGTLGHVSIKLPAQGHGEFALVHVVGKTNATGDLAIPQIANPNSLPATIRVGGAELKPAKAAGGKVDFRLLFAINNLSAPKAMQSASAGDALDLILLGATAAWGGKTPAEHVEYLNCSGVRSYLKLVAKYLVLNGGWASPSKEIFGYVLDDC
jgi:hypothetical protein